MSESVSELMVRGIVVGIFQENCWVIGSRRTGQAICIDPGDQADEILAMARDMGVTIKRVVSSHAHIDHVMAVRPVQERTGAPFMLHAADDPLLASGWAWATQQFGIEAGPAPAPDDALNDGDLLGVDGVQLRVIHTPGHTPGSVSLYADGLLFSGDTLFRGSIGRTDLPGGDYRTLMSSIVGRLLKLPDDTIVLPGHMQQTTIRDERQRNPFVLQELRQRAGG